MPATDYQGTPSHSPFASFGRSLLSLRRDAAPSMTTPPPPGDDASAELDAFQRRLAAVLADLHRAGDTEFLSAAWLRRLLDAFLACQDDLVARARSDSERRMVAELAERAVRALDVCNAARDGADQARRWERVAGTAASAVLQAPRGRVHEGHLRRARKALADLSALLADAGGGVAGTGPGGGGGGVAAFLTSHRNRSFGRAAPSRASPSRATSSSHFRSHSWSVSRTWSAARQLQAISAGMSAPCAHDLPLAPAVYAAGCLLHLAAWALVAALPCPDRAAALHAHHHHHLPPPPPRAASFPWASSLLSLQDRLAEEGRRRDRRRGSPAGLLTEIHALERAAQRLAETIDAAPPAAPLSPDREAEMREAAAELAAACAALKDGVAPLERQVRDVFHRIVRSRMDGLDAPTTINGR